MDKERAVEYFDFFGKLFSICIFEHERCIIVYNRHKEDYTILVDLWDDLSIVVDNENDARGLIKIVGDSTS